MSLEQLATDMKEQAGSVLTMDLSHWTLGINKGMEKASESLNKNITVASESLTKIVGKKSPSAKSSPSPKNFSPPKSTERQPATIRLPERAPSPVEEIAIEVEYIEDSDPDEEI